MKINLKLILFSFQNSTQATQKCVLNAIEQAPKPTPQILLLSASYGWQHLVMAHKAGLCLDVKYDKSKEVATNAGMGLRNLHIPECKTFKDKTIKIEGIIFQLY